MNLSLDGILSNARELVTRLRRDDATADTAVSQAQFVQERINSMKQVCHHNNNNNGTSLLLVCFSTATILPN